MNEQQLDVVKQALEALEGVVKNCWRDIPSWRLDEIKEHITALQSIIAQHALDKKADNARELGLSYDTPLSSFVRANDEAKAEVMERVIDKATEEQKALIGCVNHDCDQCKAAQTAVQETVAHLWECLGRWSAYLVANGDQADCAPPSWLVDAVKKATQPAAQPAVQEGRDWSLLEATQESLREHMAEIKRLKAAQPAPAPVPLTDEQREEIAKGWRGRNWTVGDIIDATEAAHGITEKGN
jgi:hypothetical protein